MVIDRLIRQIREKRNPCIVGIDPEWEKIPVYWKEKASTPAEAIRQWAVDVIDTIADIVPAVKPQMAFFEMYGAEGIRVHHEIVRYAGKRGLLVIDDSKRGDIGNTAKAYAYAHLASGGPMDADFMTISPFLGVDSMQPFLDVAVRDGKGLFILVKTSNSGSAALSDAVNTQGKTILSWLSDFVDQAGKVCIGTSGYSSIGAVVGATYPTEAAVCRKRMPNAFFLVPGYGTQGGSAADCAACFRDDGLGAVVNSSRGILYSYIHRESYDGSAAMYREIVRAEAEKMRDSVYGELVKQCRNLCY